MFEDDINTFFCGELASDALEAFGLVVDDVVSAQRSGFFCLRVVADCRNNRAAEGLRHLDGDRTDAGAACMHQNGFARFELGVVEQHVLDGTKGNRRARRVSQRNAGRYRDHQACGEVYQVTSKAVDMKAHDAADILAKVVAAFTAGGTASASHRPIHHVLVGSLEAGDASTDRGYFAGGFGANNDRQLPLCECHPTEAPKVEVIERHSLDTDL